MKAVLYSLALVALCALAISLHAQTRAVGSHAIVLDDGQGHAITIVPATPTTTYTWTLPASGPPASVTAGTKQNSTLHWAAGSSAWSEDTNVLESTAGILTADSDINSTAGSIQTNGTTRIDNAGDGIFAAMSANVVIPSGNYTAGANDFTIVDTALSDTIKLPAAPSTGRIIVVKYQNSNFQTSCTVDGNGNNIDGSLTLDVYGLQSAVLIFDGTEWDVIGGYSPAV